MDHVANGPGIQQLSEAYVPYLLEFEDETDGVALSAALVVLRREDGYLLGRSLAVFHRGGFGAGSNSWSPTTCWVSLWFAGSLFLEGPLLEEVHHHPFQSQKWRWFWSMSAPHLLPYDASNPYWDMVQFFDISHPDLFPIPDVLVAAAWDWILSPAAGDRVAYYSAEEGERVPICPMDEEEDAEEREETQPKAKAKAMPSQRPPAPGPSSTSGGKKPAVPKESNPKARKPTVASLATSLEGLSVSIPALVAEVAALSERTQAMEENIQGGQRLSALRRPLGASDLGGSAKPSSGTAIKTLLQEMPPPKTLRPKTLTLAGPPAPATAADALMEEREETAISGSTDLARAVLAQSTALTALVGQIAGLGGDGLGDLTSTSSTLTSGGAAGRARLQQELASQKGLFFTSVFQQMSRRMNPAMSSNATPMELMSRGVTATRYVERYGGFGRCRDLGQIMWQVCILLDHMQAENWEASRDAAALLAVCLEQSALDNGQLDVGLLLALVEDPPAAVFTNRSVSALSRGRAFAPLAEQRWITTALSYIKELDVISSRRADVAGTSSKPAADPPNPKPKVKRLPKAKWKKQNKEEQEE